MPMTASEFLSDWLKKNVVAAPYPMHAEVVKKCVVLCEGMAANFGITRRELAVAAGGNLRRRIATAFEDAQDLAIKAKAAKSKNSN